MMRVLKFLEIIFNYVKYGMVFLVCIFIDFFWGLDNIISEYF